MKSFKRALVVGEKNIFGELSQIIVIAAEANTYTYQYAWQLQKRGGA